VNTIQWVEGRAAKPCTVNCMEIRHAAGKISVQE
jgi:hypothetical protein